MSHSSVSREFLDIKQLSELVQVSERSLWNLYQSGQIPHVRIGKSVRFIREDVLEALRSQQQKGAQS